jgi:3-oxoacyl-[acyl-carrier protein] reductase
MSEKTKRAIVTGGSRGIGRAIVKELADKICGGVLLSDIMFIDDDAEKCAADLEKEINGADVNIYAFKADATSFEEAQATIDAAIEIMGGVDILVNNAGITRDNLLLRMSEEDFDLVLKVNQNHQ